MNNGPQKTKSMYFFYLIAFVFVASIIIIWVIARSTTLSKAGLFGDSFGVVNAFVSFCAFAGFLYAIKLQRDDLNLQRQELQLTREEIAGQREEMARQNNLFEVQKFENTFYKLLDFYKKDIIAFEDSVLSSMPSKKFVKKVVPEDDYLNYLLDYVNEDPSKRKASGLTTHEFLYSFRALLLFVEKNYLINKRDYYQIIAYTMPFVYSVIFRTFFLKICDDKILREPLGVIGKIRSEMSNLKRQSV